MNDTIEIQNYLDKNAHPADLLLTEAKLLLTPAFKDTLKWQIQSHDYIRAYGQKKLREEIQQVEMRLFSESRFSQFKKTIQNIFKK